MPSKWMSLSDALDQVKPYFSDIASAHISLVTALRRGEIQARADFYGNKLLYKAMREEAMLDLDPIFWTWAVVKPSRSYAEHPKFFPEPGMVDRPNEYIAAHGIHLVRDQVSEIWPVRTGDNQNFASDKTGGPGRPTSAHLVEAEFARLAKAGLVEKRISKQAENLAAWLKVTHPGMAPMTAGTIENSIRAAHRRVAPRN